MTTQQPHQATDVLDMVLALLGSLLQEMREKKIMSDADMSDVFNRAIAATSSKPNNAQIVAALHGILQKKS